MQLKEGLYCYLVPTGYDATTLMKDLWIDCVLPECDRHYEHALDELTRRGPTEMHDGVHVSSASKSAPTSSSSSSSSSAVSSWRSILTFDGCWPQLRAVMTRLNVKFFERSYEGFKFAAASTMVEQPNDVGHCHKAIKCYHKSDKYRKCQVWEIPAYISGFDATLSDAGLDNGS